MRLVSVIIPNCKRGKYIAEAMDAVLAQTYRNFEIIAVDDGTTDGSIKVLREYEKRSDKVRLYQHADGACKGLAETVKLALSKAKGEYVAFCSPSDKWTARHLEIKMALIDEFNGEPKVLLNGIAPFGDAELCRKAKPALDRWKKLFPKSRNRIKPIGFRGQNRVRSISCCMVAADTLRECDLDSCPEPKNIFWWLWRQACCVNDVFFARLNLTKIRLPRHASSRTSLKSMDVHREFLDRMDRLLVKRHADATEDLRRLIDEEDMFSFSSGIMLKNGLEVANAPSFSVVMATWNRAFCICTAVDSLLKQTYQNFELVICDDGSTDDTVELLAKQYKKEIAQGKIRVVSIEKSGVCRARNDALKHVKNDWVTYLDSDNQICPYFLETFARQIVLHPEAVNFYAQLVCMKSGKKIGKAFDLEALMKANYIDLGVYAHKRELIDELGPFDENMTRLEDWELIMRHCKQYIPVFIESQILLYNDGKEHSRISNTISRNTNLDYFRRKHCGEPTIAPKPRTKGGVKPYAKRKRRPSTGKRGSTP